MKKSTKFSPEIRERAVRLVFESRAEHASQVVKAFIDEHRKTFWVESICRVLQVAPSMYWRHAARLRNPELRCHRARRDERLVGEIERVWQAVPGLWG